jgi:Domain of unknown function (DUF4932)
MKTQSSLFCHLGIVSILIFLTCVNCTRKNETSSERESLNVYVDPTMELFCIIHRLADTGHDNSKELPKYINDIETYFGHYRDHRAVKLAKRLWESHRINISALSTLAVYIDSPPDLTPRNLLDPLPSEIDNRWTVDLVSEFIDASRDFARDTKFMEFFHSQEELYSRATMNLKGCLDDENMLVWFRDYFGYVPNNYTIIVGMQTGWGNYGASISGQDSTREFYSIIGAHSPFFWNDVPRFSSKDVTGIVVHEFCHPYINPLVENQRELLREAGEVLYPYHKKILSKTGTLRWDHMMNEYIVRACVIRYFIAKNDMKSVKRQITYDERYGYIDIRALSELLEEYENNRDKFTNFNSFLPRIANHFNQFAMSCSDDKGFSKMIPRIDLFPYGYVIIAAAAYWLVFIIIRIRRKRKIMYTK